eukprot:568209-Alexandrium_andersonii.AAC.1
MCIRDSSSSVGSAGSRAARPARPPGATPSPTGDACPSGAPSAAPLGHHRPRATRPWSGGC